ncbi:GntR family transcriptional regulator [Pseudomonas aeruginosa]|nr:GntR family transcriptional regulator [Pseudomonas aeruginosa]
MLDAGDLAVVEEPGYPPARASLLATGAEVRGVPVDAEGLRVDLLPDNAKLVYVTPSHQFPLGMPMSLERRLQLLDWAQHHRALIIEDDYDSEYRFDGRSLESLRSLDRNGQVAYLGTFSKTLFPELRLGYLLPPASLREAVLAARKLIDRHSETLQQRALALFIQRGDFARHTRRLQREYAQRRGRLLERLHGDLSPWLEALPAVAGIHLAARCREPLDVLRIARHLRQQGLEVGTLPPFYAETPAQAGFLFGFGCIERDDIDPALDLLRAELRR